MSARMPSPRRVRSPSAKSAREEAGLAGRLGGEASKRASAAGSRSMQISVPVGPDRARRRGARGRRRRRCSRPRSARARGASSSISSGARTGSCSVGISRERLRFAATAMRAGAISLGRSARGQALGDLGRRGVELVPPASPRPRRSRSPGTRRRRSRRRGRRGRRARSAAWARGCGRPSRASRRRSRRGSGGAGCARVAAEGAVRREEALGELLELLGRVHPDAGVEALGENDSVGEGGPEPRRNREAILGVETVLVEAPKCHPAGVLSVRAAGKRVRTEVMRWEEPHHPGPGLQLGTTVTHFPPLCNTTPIRCPKTATTLAAQPRPSAPGHRHARLGCAR